MKQSFNKFSKISLAFLFILIPVNIFSQALLTADGPGNTYELINSILAPTGGDVVENPECVHPEFGRHIAEVWDADLGQYVFEFYIHVSPDNDRCINFDRQRVEIKTYDASPANLKGTSGETVIYKWRFKVPTGFQPSSNFTHIHQVKAVGGDESDPLFVLTARKGTPNKLELNYYESSSLSSVKFSSVNLSLFENTWVEATERIKVNNVGGTYSITINKVSDGTTILSYTNNNILTIRADNSFIRPKWGIYRSLLSSQDLRDESLRINNISITEDISSKIDSNTAADENKFKVGISTDTNKLLFEYNLSDKMDVEIDAYSLNGQKVKSIFTEKNQDSGFYQNSVDISDLKSGIYLIRIQSGNYSQNCKIIIQK